MIIGRKTEQERLLHAYEAEYSRLVIIYGRRRVGKTFLVNETFRGKTFFEHTGEYIPDKAGKTTEEMLLPEHLFGGAVRLPSFPPPVRAQRRPAARELARSL